MDKIKAMKKNSEITEDDQKNAETKIQKITDDFIKEIDEVADNKEKEIWRYEHCGGKFSSL